MSKLLSAYSRLMEKHRIQLSAVPTRRGAWVVKVVVLEKTVPRKVGSKDNKMIKLVIMDEENTKMQCLMFDHKMEKLETTLELYKTYHIGNATVCEIDKTWTSLVPSDYELVLDKKAYISLLPREQAIPVTNAYDISSFKDCYRVTETIQDNANILCCVVQHIQPQSATTRRKTQDFVIINSECKPMKLTLWENNQNIDALALASNVHKTPIILAMRLSINTFDGISVTSTATTTILFDPPILETRLLRQWLTTNGTYIQTMTSEKLYEKDKQEPEPPLPSQIKPLIDITSRPDTLKSFWIKASAQIEATDQPLYIMTCPGCAQPCGGFYLLEFTCRSCDRNFPAPFPKLRFRVVLSDDTDTIHATIEGKQAETALQMPTKTIIEKDEAEGGLNIVDINSGLIEEENLYQLRSYHKSYGDSSTQYSILSCLPMPAPFTPTEPHHQTTGKRKMSEEVSVAQPSGSKPKTSRNT